MYLSVIFYEILKVVINFFYYFCRFVKHLKYFVDFINNSAHLRCDYTTKKKIYFDDHISGGLKYWRCPWCEDHLPFKQRGRHTVF